MSCQYKDECPSYTSWCEGPKRSFASCISFLVPAYDEVKKELEKYKKSQTKLGLQEYCDGCPDIEPEVRVNEMCSGDKKHFDVWICCKNEHKCRNIQKFLMKKKEE